MATRSGFKKVLFSIAPSSGAFPNRSLASYCLLSTIQRLNMATHSGLKDYEDYTVTSQDYDKYRTAVGPEVVLGALTYSTGKPAKELHVLDAGCGTGNYTVALSKYFGKMTNTVLL